MYIYNAGALKVPLCASFHIFIFHPELQRSILAQFIIPPKNSTAGFTTHFMKSVTRKTSNGWTFLRTLTGQRHVKK